MPADYDLSKEMEAFSAEYRASLPQRLTDIDAAWAAVKRGETEGDPLRVLLRNLHSIAGSALTFGLPDLGKAAAAAEDWVDPYCERGELPPAAAQPELEPLLALVRRAAAG